MPAVSVCADRLMRQGVSAFQRLADHLTGCKRWGVNLPC